MGTIKKGILGGFSGKVGNVIGANWRGLDVMRSLPKKNSAEPTEAQVEQRLKFGLVMAFISPLKGILDKAFGNAQGSKSKFNLATSYHIQQAIMGTMPNLTLDYSKVVMTKGELLGPKAPTVALNNPAEVQFNWQDNSDTGLSAADDEAVFLVYNPVKKLYVLEEGTFKREDLSATLQVPLIFSGDVVHCWMGYLSADEKDAATSVYLGEYTIL